MFLVGTFLWAEDFQQGNHLQHNRKSKQKWMNSWLVERFFFRIDNVYYIGAAISNKISHLLRCFWRL